MLLKDVSQNEPFPNVVHLEFPTQELMTSVFLRFQEYYESPKFKDKIFSFEEFKKWYIAEKGAFSYSKDWPGFNIPSSVLRPFYEGKFDPLSEVEGEFLELFKGRKEPFYIIGTALDNAEEYRTHEFAHAFFYIYPEYKEEALSMIHSLPAEDHKELCEMINIGYHESVMDDEIQAHLIANFEELVSEGLSREKYHTVQEKLLGIYNRHYKG